MSLLTYNIHRLIGLLLVEKGNADSCVSYHICTTQGWVIIGGPVVCLTLGPLGCFPKVITVAGSCSSRRSDDAWWKAGIIFPIMGAILNAELTRVATGRIAAVACGWGRAVPLDPPHGRSCWPPALICSLSQPSDMPLAPLAESEMDQWQQCQQQQQRFQQPVHHNQN